MATKKFFTDESLATFVDEVKSYTDALSIEAIRATNEGSVAIGDGTEVTNQLLISTDDNGNVYNDIGYKNEIRWSESGKKETASSVNGMSGYIPCTSGSVLKVKNITVATDYKYIALFDSSKTCLGVQKLSNLTTDVNGVYSITITYDYTNIAFIRTSFCMFNSESIILVNEDFSYSCTAQVGWLKTVDDKNISPIVVSSQVITEDGEVFEDYVKTKLDETKKYTDLIASNKANKLHSHTCAHIDCDVPTQFVSGDTLEDMLMNVDSALSSFDSTHETKTDAQNKLTEAKEYTDTKTTNLASTSTVDSKISTHNTSTSAHNDIRELIIDLNTKLNNFLDVDDTTADQLSEVLTLIENNKGTLESLTTSKINVADIINNLTTASTSKVLSANQGVVIKKLIDDLQSELNECITTDVFSSHIGNTTNPHRVTKEQIGLENVDNTADANKSVKYATSAGSATKLETAKTINVSGGIAGTAKEFDGSKNISIPVREIYDSYTVWGGKNVTGNISAIDGAASNLHSANRFAFARPRGITVEYSRDGGTTWNSYTEATDEVKTTLISGVGLGTKLYIGGEESLGSVTLNDKLRITFNANDMFVYTRLRKLLINITTNGATGCYVDVEKAMNGSEATFVEVGSYSIGGWSGWNSIPMGFVFGGSGTNNAGILRLTFRMSALTESASNRLAILDIYAIGDTYWSTPSTLARIGHLYDYDANKNATFPAKVTATSFVGNLTGKADSATTADKLTGVTATATELNYVDGVTSNIQTQLDGKASNTLSNGTETAGLIKTTSTTTSNIGYIASPVLDGVPYYQDSTQTIITSGGTPQAYTATVAGIKELKNGVSFIMKAHAGFESAGITAPVANPTLNVNNLGAKTIKMLCKLNENANTLQSQNNVIYAGDIVLMVYEDGYWNVMAVFNYANLNKLGFVKVRDDLATPYTQLPYIVPTQASVSNKFEELDKVKDEIAYGANENGEYYKFQNGLLICTKQVTVSGNVTGDVIKTSSNVGLSLGNWAHQFIETPTVSVSPISSSSAGHNTSWLLNLYHPPVDGTVNIGTVKFATTTNTTNASIILDVIGIGRWAEMVNIEEEVEL